MIRAAFFALALALGLCSSVSAQQAVIPIGSLPLATPSPGDVVAGVHGGVLGVGGTTTKFTIGGLVNATSPVFNIFTSGGFGDLASDTIAVAAAYAAAPSTGATFYFPQAVATYVLPQEAFTKPISIVCDGRSSTSLKYTGTTLSGYFLQWTGQSNLKIVGCAIDASSATSSNALLSSALFVFNGTNIAIEDDTVKMPVSSGSTTFYSNGITVQSIADLWIKDNIVSQAATSSNPNEAILMADGGNGFNAAHIEGNLATNSGIETSGTDTWINNNKVTGACFGSGITESSASVRSHTIHNHIHGCGAGIDSNGFLRDGIETYTPDEEVVGNYADNNSGTGLGTNGPRQKITGNSFINNLGPGIIVAYTSATLTSSYDIIEDNQLGDNQVTHTQTYGIQDASVATGLVGFIVANNNTVGVTTAPYAFYSGSTGFLSASGTGVPTFSAPSSSTFNRSDGTSGNRFYINSSTASTSGTSWTSFGP